MRMVRSGYILSWFYQKKKLRKLLKTGKILRLSTHA